MLELLKVLLTSYFPGLLFKLWITIFSPQLLPITSCSHKVKTLDYNYFNQCFSSPPQEKTFHIWRALSKACDWDFLRNYQTGKRMTALRKSVFEKTPALFSRSGCHAALDLWAIIFWGYSQLESKGWNQSKLKEKTQILLFLLRFSCLSWIKLSDFAISLYKISRVLKTLALAIFTNFCLIVWWIFWSSYSSVFADIIPCPLFKIRQMKLS